VGFPDFTDVVCVLYSRVGEGANIGIQGKQCVDSSARTLVGLVKAHTQVYNNGIENPKNSLFTNSYSDVSKCEV
jgi:hypothetical protein